MANGWQPQHHHQIWHSLADPRARVNNVERNGQSFNHAVAMGQNYRWHLGDPSFIRIPTELRTFQGGDATKGRIGEGIHYGYIQSSPSFSAYHGYNVIGSPGQGTWGGSWITFDPMNPYVNYHGTSWENAHRWHARHSLPPTTEVIFHQNLPYSLFEGRTDNQFIGVNFTFRTNSSNGLWDLSVYSGASNQPPYPSSLDAPPHERYLEPPNQLIPVPNRTGRNTGRDWWLRPRGGNEVERGQYHWTYPFVPVIVFDYSNSASSDRTTIGTH